MRGRNVSKIKKARFQDAKARSVRVSGVAVSERADGRVRKRGNGAMVLGGHQTTSSGAD